jgi:hypothetical protein
MKTAAAAAAEAIERFSSAHCMVQVGRLARKQQQQQGQLIQMQQQQQWRCRQLFHGGCMTQLGAAAVNRQQKEQQQQGKQHGTGSSLCYI